MPVAFRGRRTCECVAESLPVIEEYMILTGLIQNNIDIFQMGYNAGGVAASAGTHDGGGCTDVGQFSDAQIDVWRRFGWTMQYRTRAQGFDPHGHGFPNGCPHLSAGARHQQQQWNNGTNGLAGYGPIHGRYPIPHWKTALKEMEKEMASLEDRIADRVVAKLNGRLDKIDAAVSAVPGRTWDADVIPNAGLTDNPKNKFLTAKSAIVELWRESNAARNEARAALAAAKASNTSK